MQTRDPLSHPPPPSQCNAISPINSSGFSQREALDKRARPSEVGHFRNVEEEDLLGDMVLGARELLTHLIRIKQTRNKSF